jgi:tRNA-Thr(GGU) m(6)t(6)A37 methyltransferase TsaA
MDSIPIKPIGVLHTPFAVREGIPRQAAGAQQISATIEIFPAYEAGLSDLEGFSHIVVLFYMHLIETEDLIAHPPWDGKPHGVFSTCSPFRPNHIGVSVVQLEKIEGNHLAIRGVDMADGSPVLDIKPYIPELYPREKIRLGWMSGKIDGMTGSKTGDR